MEVAEQRLTMFQRPHKLPIGRARSNMGSDEYNKLAQPALKDCYDHEHKVLEIFEKHAASKHQGEQMQQVVFGRGSNTLVHHDDWGAARKMTTTGHEGKDTESRHMSKLLADDFSGDVYDGKAA